MVEMLVGMGELMERLLAARIECGCNVGRGWRCGRVNGGDVQAGAVREVCVVRLVLGSRRVCVGAGEAIVFQQCGDGEEVGFFGVLPD